MRLTRMLTLLPALGLLVSCAPTAPPSDHCAGWEPITGAAETVDWLAAHDADLLKAVIGHDAFGRAQGCWP